jgi:hypothetical protein
MGCNCKKKPKPIIDTIVGLELIKKGIIDEEKLSINETNTLYDFYDNIYNQDTSKTCLDCWNTFIKEKLRDYYIQKL